MLGSYQAITDITENQLILLGNLIYLNHETANNLGFANTMSVQRNFVIKEFIA